MRDHRVGLLHLALVKCPGLRIVPPGDLGSFGKGPCQVFVAAFFVALAFFLIVADPFGRNFPAVGTVVADLRKTADRTGLQHDGKSQRLTHALHREELFILVAQLHSFFDNAFDGFDLARQKIYGFLADLAGQCQVFVLFKKRRNAIRIQCLDVIRLEPKSVVTANDVLQTDNERSPELYEMTSFA